MAFLNCLHRLLNSCRRISSDDYCDIRRQHQQPLVRHLVDRNSVLLRQLTESRLQTRQLRIVSSSVKQLAATEWTPHHWGDAHLLTIIQRAVKQRLRVRNTHLNLIGDNVQLMLF